MTAGGGPASRVLGLTRISRDGSTQSIDRPIAAEVPLSIEYGGIAYAVMMVSPANLEDFVTGFSLSEGLIERPADIEALAIAEIERGWVARIALRAPLMERIYERARARVSEGSCGLCGLAIGELVYLQLQDKAAVFIGKFRKVAFDPLDHVFYKSLLRKQLPGPVGGGLFCQTPL